MAQARADLFDLKPVIADGIGHVSIKTPDGEYQLPLSEALILWLELRSACGRAAQLATEDKRCQA